MMRTASGSTAATRSQDCITALCASDIPTVNIGSQEDPFVVISNIQQQGATLTKLTGMTIEKFTQWKDSPSRRGRLFFYSFEHEVMILKLPLSHIHEYLHRALEIEIIHGLSASLYQEIAPYGSTTFEMIRGGIATSAGEGDSRIGPEDDERNDGWPTMVIEAGWSQSRAALVAKAHWWFEASNRAVKIVLLITATPLQIQIEKWKTSPLPHSTAGPNRSITQFYQREATDPKIHPPILTINRASVNTPSNDYKVTGSPLGLEFRDVFLRNPVPPEGDILLEERFFQRYAELAWKRIRRGT